MRLASLLVFLTLSSCCTTQGCQDAVNWMLGTPLENGTYVINACVDEDCDEATVTIVDGGSNMTGTSRVSAVSTNVSLTTTRTDGIRARLEIKRDGATVISDLRSLTWMTTSNPGACSANCRLAVIALE